MSVIRIAFLIRKLEIGGAERQLCQLAAGLDRAQFCPLVLTFYQGGAFEKSLIDAGVQVICLHKQGRWDLLSFQRKLVSTLRTFSPHLIHAFQGPPNLLALLARPFVADMRVIWGFRASNMELRKYDYSRWLVAAAMLRTSRRIDLAIANSHAGKAHAIMQGYDGERFRVVPNGIDVATFRHDEKAGISLRQQWGLSSETPLIGLVARLDQKKDHITFLAAAEKFAARYPSARFACIGGGTEDQREHLYRQAQNLGLERNMIWAGPRSDIPLIFSAMDVNTLTSRFGEGFPNSIGEAMAVGVPCVVTDCGDAALIVGPTGVVAAPGDAAAIAAGWEHIFSLPAEEREALRARCRARIVERFSLDSMIRKSAELYIGLVHETLPPAGNTI